MKPQATHEQMMKVIEEYLTSDESIAKIAMRNGCTGSGCLNKMRALGIVKQPRPNRLKKISDEKSKKAFELILQKGLSPTEACKRASVHGRNFKQWLIENNLQSQIPKRKKSNWNQNANPQKAYWD